jgi:hypothetical protein
MKLISGALKGFAGLVVILFLIGLFSGNETHHSSQQEDKPRYSESWVDYPNKEISIALAKKNAKGCACYDHKHNKSRSEFLVRCGCELSEYKYYTVWTGINEVLGPYSSEAEAP